MDAGLGTHASTAEVEPDRHAIAAELGRRGIDLAFASLLEATFEAATSAARTRHLIISGVLAMVLSNLFLVADARLVPDVFGYSILLHVVCTVIYSLALFYTARTPPANLREAAHGTCLTMGLLGTIGLVSLSGAPDRGYLVGTYVLFIVYANVVIRLRFIWCVTFNATGTLAATAAALTFQGLPEGARVLMPLSVLTAAAYTLYANYTIEAGERRAFLLALDQRLAAAEQDLAAVDKMNVPAIDAAMARVQSAQAMVAAAQAAFERTPDASAQGRLIALCQARAALFRDAQAEDTEAGL